MMLFVHLVFNMLYDTRPRAHCRRRKALASCRESKWNCQWRLVCLMILRAG